jgi:hypothetical protein
MQEYDIPKPELRWCCAACANLCAVDPDLVDPKPQEYFTADFSCEREKMYVNFRLQLFFSFCIAGIAFSVHYL